MSETLMAKGTGRTWEHIFMEQATTEEGIHTRIGRTFAGSDFLPLRIILQSLVDDGYLRPEKQIEGQFYYYLWLESIRDKNAINILSRIREDKELDALCTELMDWVEVCPESGNKVRVGYSTNGSRKVS